MLEQESWATTPAVGELIFENSLASQSQADDLIIYACLLDSGTGFLVKPKRLTPLVALFAEANKWGCFGFNPSHTAFQTIVLLGLLGRWICVCAIFAVISFYQPACVFWGTVFFQSWYLTYAWGIAACFDSCEPINLQANAKKGDMNTPEH